MCTPSILLYVCRHFQIVFLFHSVPAPPAIPVVTERTSSSLTVSWTYDNPPSGAVILGYNIYVDGALVGTTSGEDMRYTITGLNPFTNYSIEVSAFNENEGLRSDVVTALTDEGRESLYTVV